MKVECDLLSRCPIQLELDVVQLERRSFPLFLTLRRWSHILWFHVRKEYYITNRLLVRQ